jgi:hypothetical protein
MQLSRPSPINKQAMRALSYKKKKKSRKGRALSDPGTAWMNKRVSCSVCGAMLHPGKLTKHMARSHSPAPLTSESTPTKNE